jgi:hypothetical protein
MKRIAKTLLSLTVVLTFGLLTACSSGGGSVSKPNLTITNNNFDTYYNLVLDSFVLTAHGYDNNYYVTASFKVSLYEHINETEWDTIYPFNLQFTIKERLYGTYENVTYTIVRTVNNQKGSAFFSENGITFDNEPAYRWSTYSHVSLVSFTYYIS